MGVNTPARMPPIRMNGQTSAGSARQVVASRTAALARGKDNPAILLPRQCTISICTATIIRPGITPAMNIRPTETSAM